MSEEKRQHTDKPKKFFGFEVSDTVSYLVVIVLAIILIRQISELL